MAVEYITSKCIVTPACICLGVCVDFEREKVWTQVHVHVLVLAVSMNRTSLLLFLTCSKKGGKALMFSPAVMGMEHNHIGKIKK